MWSRQKFSKWVLAAAVPAVVATYYAFTLPGETHAQPHASEVTASRTADEAPLVTGLPDFTALVERYGPSVVNVSVTETAEPVANQAPFSGIPENSPFYDFFRRFGVPMPPQAEAPIRRGEGSGFIVSTDGLVLTNAHVVGDASDITVKLMDRREFTAKVVGIDKQTDVAVLQIDAQDLPAVRIGDAKNLKVGEWVVAIGSPFGFENTVTSGIVSGKSRSLPSDSYVPFIQTDVAVNPGNSGGPLFNMKGEVVGVNSQIFSRTGGYMGLSFAIPIDVAMNVKDQLVAHGAVTRGRIGVRIQEVDQSIAQSFGMKQATGALVSDVESDGPADKAGIRNGDVIVAVDGEAIKQVSELPAVIAAKKPGSEVSIDVWRNGEQRSVDVTIGRLENEKVAAAQPDKQAQTGKLGLAVRDLTADEKAQLDADDGVLVERAEGPAAAAGLRRGDVILAIGSTPVKSVKQLVELSEKAGKTVALLIQRNNQRSYVPIQAG